MVRYIKRAKNDLFRNALGQLIFKNGRFITTIRILVAGLFFYAIYLGFAYPGKENLFTTALFWGLFWPFFIVTTLPTFGRIFCGICPHGFLGRYITRIGLKRKMPSWLANRYIGIFLLFLGWWGVYYAFPGAMRSPLGTAILFSVMTAVAFLFYFLYREMSYCKYICPIGTALRAYGKLSFTFFGSYQTACGSCKTFDCARSCPYGLSPFNFNKKHSIGDCTLCMECTHACEAIHYRLVPPGYAIYQKFKPLAAEIWVYLLILAAIPISMAFAHGLGHSNVADEMIWSRTARWLGEYIDFGTMDAAGAFAFVYATLFTLVSALGGIWIASKILNKNFREVFLTLGYAFAPLFILASMAHAWEFFLTSNSARIVEGFAWGFGVQLDVDPLVKRGTPWLQFFHIFRWVAVVWAFYILYRRFAYLEAPKLRKILAYPFAGLLIFFFIGVNLYRNYILDTYGRSHRGMHMGTSFQQVAPSKATLLMQRAHKESCAVCGMKLARFYKTNHAATVRGETRQFCSIHCLAQAKRRGEDLSDIRVVDTETLRFIPVEKAFYVIGSSRPGTMSRISKYAFGSEKSARNFQRRFGGRLGNFDSALHSALQELDGNAATVTLNSLIFFSRKNPNAMAHGAMGHSWANRSAMHRHTSASRSMVSSSVRRRFWLATGSLDHPRCVRNVKGKFLALDRDGREFLPNVVRQGPCSRITIPLTNNGYYSLYYLWETPQSLTVAKVESKYFNHGSQEPFSKEKIAPRTSKSLPVDLLRLRGERENSFYYTLHTGETLRFKLLKSGRPKAGALVTLRTQFGWGKSVRTDRNGIATFQLIQDYQPPWQQFDKRFKEHFVVTARFRDDNRSYRLYFTGSYRPGREIYTSYKTAFWFITLLLIVTAAGVMIYRLRVHKPFREDPRNA